MAETKSGTAVAKKGEAFDTLKKLLEVNKPSIAAALPRHMTADRMLRVALTAARTTPDLLKCDPKSVVEQILTVSQLGLEPNDVRGLAYLIPFKNNAAQRYDCQLIIGYKGFADLARRSGQVSTLNSFIVYDKEPFQFLAGSLPTLSHQPLPPAQRGQNKVGVYAVAVLKDGTSQFAFMWADEVEGIRKKSPAARKSGSPWETAEEEMWKKTAVRRLAKLLPLSPEWNMAAAVDEYQEAGVAGAQAGAGFFTEDEDEPEKPLEDSVQPELKPADQQPEKKEDPPAKQDPTPKTNDKPTDSKAPSYPPEGCPKAAVLDGQKCAWFDVKEETCGELGPCMFKVQAKTK